MVDERFRLSDAELQRFLVDGYLVLHPEFPDGFHARVYDRIGTVMEQVGNPFNNILPLVPELGSVFGHPRVAGTLASILGDDYYLHMHRHCHDRAPGGGAQRLHKDSLYNSRYAVDGNRRHHHARWVMAFYYPQDTGEEMGPTAIVPRSQYLLEQQREEDEIHLTGVAGTVVIVHYDIWHRASGTVSAAHNRYMVKFLFTRMSDPREPSWRHEPGAEAPFRESNGVDHGTSSGPRLELPEVWGHQWRWHLGQSGSGAGSPASAHGSLASLFEKLADEDERAALEAAYRLGRGGGDAARPLAEALRSSDERVRRNAAYGFAPLGAAAVPALSDLAGDADPAVRARAVDALGDVGPPARAAANGAGGRARRRRGGRARACGGRPRPGMRRRRRGGIRGRGAGLRDAGRQRHRAPQRRAVAGAHRRRSGRRRRPGGRRPGDRARRRESLRERLPRCSVCAAWPRRAPTANCSPAWRRRAGNPAKPPPPASAGKPPARRAKYTSTSGS